MFRRISPYEREIQKLKRQEAAFLKSRQEKNETKLNGFLKEKIPEQLQTALDKAFAKAFQLVFEKGVAIIEKTYNKNELVKDFQVNQFASKVHQNSKSLKKISGKATNAGRVNLLLSGVSGVGLGVLGIGIPDIVLFTGLMLKGIYEIALNYGYSYESEAEKQFILMLIQGAVSYGDELNHINRQIDEWITNPSSKENFSDDTQCLITAASVGLSKELLYMKFLQGIPVVGAIGGAYDAVYMKQIMKYSELKYRKRYYLRE